MFGNVKAKLDLLKDYFYTKRALKTEPHLFDHVETYCMFVGYPRSSHSLIGSLIDAHPQTNIAHEQDVLKYIKYGFSKEAIFHLLLRNAKQFTEAGREWTGYSYAVEGQYQGKYTDLKVIGDKRGGNSSRRFSRNPDLLKKLKKTIDLPIKFIHVIRNPYDNISTMAYRVVGSDKSKVTPEALTGELEHYFSLVETANSVFEQVDVADVIHVKIENFMEHPKEELKRICDFLGLETTEEYLNACAAIVYTKPHKTRNDYTWDEALKARVSGEIEKYPFFEGYSFTA
ncbi:sulfotransferase [Sulfurimonas sp. HSL1-6]|uniref:sulfotransferase family protein n=1 Tax=Thiomicrolovo immobilis TaxID=3131935 RepID=UPI0031F74A12